MPAQDTIGEISVAVFQLAQPHLLQQKKHPTPKT